MYRYNERPGKGFTLIELMLAMTFVSLLLLTIAFTIIQISNIYNKGLTLRAVDQAGRTISDDIKRVLQQSQPFEVDDSRLVMTSTGGRFCAGDYSYIWNLGQFIGTDDPNLIVYSDDTIPTTPIRLIRVSDVGGRYCTETPMPNILIGNATDLLGEGDRELVVHEFDVQPIAYDDQSGQALYRVIVQIGTSDFNAFETSAGAITTVNQCKPPSTAEGFEDYCAVNRFVFTAWAGGKGGP